MSSSASENAAADCVFCRIVTGSAPASFVWDDDRVVAFMDIQPVTPGHLLVVPRDHLPMLADVTPALVGHMMHVAQRMAQRLRDSEMRCEGINLFYADGEAALQEVFHSHLHVIPRFAGDGFRISADRSHSPDRAELDAQATVLRVEA